MGQEIFYSIIIVCLNSGQRLYDTIDSILEQTYSNYEVIIKDGDSSDGSVKTLAERYTDARLHVHIKKDKGIYDANIFSVFKYRG